MNNSSFFGYIFGFFVVIIIMLICLGVWYDKAVEEYIVNNNCTLTGNIESVPLIWCDSNSICYYDESHNYEYFCKATNETKWFNYKFTN